MKIKLCFIFTKKFELLNYFYLIIKNDYLKLNFHEKNRLLIN